VRPGDRIVLVVPSSAALLVAVLGALRSGVVPVPLNPALLPAEQDALLADAEPALVVRELDDLSAGDDEGQLAPYPLARPMHYTSGTTGRSKGVWSGILSDADAAALARDEADLWGFDRSDVHLVCSPFWHSAPIRFAGGTLLAGGDVVVLGAFDAVAAATAIAEHRPTTAFMVPAHLQRLFALDAEPDLTSFRLLAHAGEACPAPLKRRAIDAFPDHSVYEFYGSTEGQFTVCSSDEWLERPGTVGRARPGRTLHVDGDGLVWCTPPPFARFEYWRDPAKTAAAWEGGAFTVGDIGRLDDDGYLFLDGRRDDLIISGGVNVYPVEVEEALRTFPEVDDVAVFGMADERWGQRVCAAVTAEVDTAALLAHARSRLAPYKVPKDVFRIDALPRTTTGKIRRSAIPDLLEDQRPRA
jgi:long-chain acyl-CoA synthetase